MSNTLPWRKPLHLARIAAGYESHWCLLYSGQQQGFSGEYSYLCLYPQETVGAESFRLLADKLGNNRPKLENAWFGYLAYELLHELEALPRESRHTIALSPLHFTRYGLVLEFNHTNRRLTAHCMGKDIPGWIGDTAPSSPSLPGVSALASNMTRAQYLQAVAETRQAIERGDFYQANITRKFTGQWESAPDAFALFEKLCEQSPACYSAFMQMGDTSILSSSPERFLAATNDGTLETRPIKGTAPRSPVPADDDRLREALRQSTKDRAENLMIVDLMRNDLARSCEAGSIEVKNLFEVTSYATLHHMASTVSGRKRRDISTLESVMRCFPPGSMTGAPKIRAMGWCLQQEHIQRGVYSGALGWFGGDGSCDLSVVIRTLVMQGNRFEFQVGGGIVADSDPQKEWQETMTKARGIAATLGISLHQLEQL